MSPLTQFCHNPQCPASISMLSVPITDIAFDETRLFVPQLRFQSLRDLERVIANGFDVQAEIKRQEVLEGIETHAIGDERGPLGFHIQQLRGDRLGQQSRQGSKG